MKPLLLELRYDIQHGVRHTAEPDVHREHGQLSSAIFLALQRQKPWDSFLGENQRVKGLLGRRTISTRIILFLNILCLSMRLVQLLVRHIEIRYSITKPARAYPYDTGRDQDEMDE
jgi:hypothetical protein